MGTSTTNKLGYDRKIHCLTSKFHVKFQAITVFQVKFNVSLEIYKWRFMTEIDAVCTQKYIIGTVETNCERLWPNK